MGRKGLSCTPWKRGGSPASGFRARMHAPRAAPGIQLALPAVDSRPMLHPFLGLTDSGLADDEARWAQVRRPHRHSDDALTGTARHWLRRLPPARKPLRLCERFPRVANRIAWCWPDAALCAQVFDDLLLDRRGG